jgi:hypothetical protein
MKGSGPVNDPFFGNIGGLLGTGTELHHIEVTPTGAAVFTTKWAGPMTWGGYPGWGPVWWCSATDYPNLSNGYIYFNMEFHDLEGEFGNTGAMWGHWGNNPAGVDGATYKLTVPYGVSSYLGIDGYYPADHTGSVDGLVSDNEALRLAIDGAPQGLSSSFDRIFYYMEGPPDEYGIEIFANNSSFAFPMNLGTIDTDLMGTPVDISCVNSYGNVSGAVGNWLLVLEDNGDSTWQVAVFDQNGALVGERSQTYDGDAACIDVNLVNQTFHVWAFGTDGDLDYFIFGF